MRPPNDARGGEGEHLLVVTPSGIQRAAATPPGRPSGPLDAPCYYRTTIQIRPTASLAMNSAPSVPTATPLARSPVGDVPMAKVW